MTRQKTAAARQREGRETKEAYFWIPGLLYERHYQALRDSCRTFREMRSDAALFTGEQKAGFPEIFFIYV